jgi:hypothetical protein
MNTVVRTKINGEEIELDVLTAADGKDPAKDRALYAVVLAWYRKILRAADDDYRAWRATAAENILAKKKKSAPSEWKVRAMIESDRGFAVHKERIRDLQQVVETLEGAIQAIDARVALQGGRNAASG